MGGSGGSGGLTTGLFQRTLTDMIKGMRTQTADLEGYVAQCVTEIKAEAAHAEAATKACAVQKAAYLHMLGYDMSDLAFRVVEVSAHAATRHCHVAQMARWRQEAGARARRRPPLLTRSSPHSHPPRRSCRCPSTRTSAWVPLPRARCSRSAPR